MLLKEQGKKMIWPKESHTPYAPLVRYNSHPNAAKIRNDQIRMKRLEELAGTMAGHDLLLVLPRKCPTAKHACKVNIAHDTPLASATSSDPVEP